MLVDRNVVNKRECQKGFNRGETEKAVSQGNGYSLELRSSSKHFLHTSFPL